MSFPRLPVPVSCLAEKDREDLRFGIEQAVDYVAISFVRSAADIQEVRKFLHDQGANIPIVAKLERAEIVANLQGLLPLVDAVMVARGDLGVEVPLEEVPVIQKDVIRQARLAKVPVIVATQMLESMVTHSRPTRAEVSDVANAVLDGTDAVMTSAETASGRYPIETVEMMAAICAEAEQSEYNKLDADFLNARFTRIDQSIAYGALFTAHHLGCKAIVALTDSGSTALWMSRHRIHVPIYALTPKVETQRKMALYRNVRPLLMDQSVERDMALGDAEAHLKRRGIVASGDIYAITCGEPMGAPGGTNMLKICRVA